MKWNYKVPAPTPTTTTPPLPTYRFEGNLFLPRPDKRMLDATKDFNEAMHHLTQQWVHNLLANDDAYVRGCNTLKLKPTPRERSMPLN